MKNPPRQRGGRAQKFLIECSSDSLAVFYVEQVALNRHVSSTTSLKIFLSQVKAFFGMVARSVSFASLKGQKHLSLIV